ncbi:MAG: hypothetical protein M3220_22420 [Chloroflexota bacterium]|nr:hypothetical protein [Chloroflexota bacterium]
MSRPGLVLQAIESMGIEALAPPSEGVRRQAEFLSDGEHPTALARQPGDLGPLDVPCRIGERPGAALNGRHLLAGHQSYLQHHRAPPH